MYFARDVVEMAGHCHNQDRSAQGSTLLAHERLSWSSSLSVCSCFHPSFLSADNLQETALPYCSQRLLIMVFVAWQDWTYCIQFPFDASHFPAPFKSSKQYLLHQWCLFSVGVPFLDHVSQVELFPYYSNLDQTCRDGALIDEEKIEDFSLFTPITFTYYVHLRNVSLTL